GRPGQAVPVRRGAPGAGPLRRADQGPAGRRRRGADDLQRRGEAARGEQPVGRGGRGLREGPEALPQARRPEAEPRILSGEGEEGSRRASPLQSRCGGRGDLLSCGDRTRRGGTVGAPRGAFRDGKALAPPPAPTPPGKGEAWPRPTPPWLHSPR